MSKRKLLLADDSKTIQKVVNLTFADQGIEVLTANDGATALRMVAEFAPGLVLVDVNLPGLNGFEICEQIKKRADSPTIPVILLVGSFEPFDENRASRAGADDFLTKPFQSIGQLVRKVSALLPLNGGENFSSATTETNLDVENGDRPESTRMNDENIRTDQIGSLPADESRKFETKLVIEPSEDFVPGASENPRETHFKNTDEYAAVGELGTEKTRALSAGEVYEVTADTEDTKPEQINTPVDESINEQHSVSVKTARESELTEEIQAGSEGIQTSERFSPEQIQTDEGESASPKNVSDEFASLFETYSFNSLDDTNIIETPVFQTANFPPEMIDAIADKIIEKLFEKIVREVAFQVVEQKADSIIRQVLEQRLKQ